MLIHVIDASSKTRNEQIKVVNDVLEDIGANTQPRIAAFNKCDISEEFVPNFLSGYDKTVNISAKTGNNINKLIETTASLAPGKKEKVTVVLPYSDASLLNMLHTNQKVINEEYTEKGIRLELLADESAFKKLKPYIERG